MSKDRLVKFSQAVEYVYAAALRPELWPEAVAAVATLQRADNALVLTPVLTPADGGYLIPHNIDEQMLQEWGARYIRHDIWTQVLNDQGLMVDGFFGRGEAIIEDRKFLDSLFYREFLAPRDIRRLCTGVVFDGRTQGLPLTMFSLFRGHRNVAFNDQEAKLHGLLLRHVSQALGTMLRLRDSEFRLATSLQALDRLCGSLVLLNSRGKVIFANRAALMLLESGDGLALHAGNSLTDGLGRLKVAHPHYQAQLDAAIRVALQYAPQDIPHFSQGLKIPRDNGQAPLLLQLAPLAETQRFSIGIPPAAAIMFITDPSAVPELNIEALCRLFAITPAEARVAQELLRGDSLADIATRLRLNENTVKTHLARLFVKTDTHRQSQLVRLLMSFVTPQS